MADFKIPPISTLVGTTFSNFLKVVKGNKIEPGYYLNVVLTFLVIAIATPFHWKEKLVFRQKVKNYKFNDPPLFILGHWRSGTTYLHSVLCRADDAGYLTTYHSLFPNNLSSKYLFKNFMKWKMPDKRPSDNVKLNINFPQEDEFAMGNICPYSYYNFFYFPLNYKYYFQAYGKFESSPEAVISKWKKQYRQMIAKANINSGGSRAIIKNPVNTSRYHLLLEEFPDARFVHILRNPYIVYLSTKRFFIELMPTLWFHRVSEEFIEEMILTIYEDLYEAFLKNRHLLTDDNFLELKFEDFEKDPMKHLRNLYDKLGLKDFHLQEKRFSDYVSGQKGYKKNRYKISKREYENVSARWGKYLTQWKYTLPEDIEVI